MQRRIHRTSALFTAFSLAAILIGCGGNPPERNATNNTNAPTGETKSGAPQTAASGTINIDGSSTVFPISQAVAEEFSGSNPNVKVPVGKSGTGGGFKKFASKEIEITGASRPIKKEEAEAAQKNGVEFIELPVAYDGLTVVVNSGNDFAKSLTVAELKKIWDKTSTISNWKDVRAGFPDLPMKLYGPGTDSGTFDYFTKAVNGEEKVSRADYTASEDDNTLVQGVAGDKGALGYFGFAYYEENKDKLKAVEIDGGKGAVAPSAETIRGATYQPLSRPLFIYVRKDAAERPEVQAFIKYLLSAEGRKRIEEVGYVPLPDKAYELVLAHFEKRKTGSIFGGGSQIGVKIEDIMSKE